MSINRVQLQAQQALAQQMRQDAAGAANFVNVNSAGTIYIGSNGTLTFTPAGYEGAGAKNADAPDPVAKAQARVAHAVREMVLAVKGETVANAISALHAQHTSDGRPARYMP